MGAPAWPHDPRRQRQVGRLRLRVPQAAGMAGALGAGGTAGDRGSGAVTWRSRVEDALRCADLGTGQRLVMLRRVQVKAGSAAAPGWSAVVEAACREATRQARHGADPAAARADAVWFADWDEAMGTWVEATLQGGNAAAAWFWPRVARLAGWPGACSDPPADRPAAPYHGSAHAGQAGPGSACAPAGVAAAQALLELWQRDPASQRAARLWLQGHPEAARLLRDPAAAEGGRAEEASGPGPLESAPTKQACLDPPVPAAPRAEAQPGNAAATGWPESAQGSSAMSCPPLGGDAERQTHFAQDPPATPIAAGREPGPAAVASRADGRVPPARASGAASLAGVASSPPLQVGLGSGPGAATAPAADASPSAAPAPAIHPVAPEGQVPTVAPPADPPSPLSRDRSAPGPQAQAPSLTAAKAASPTGWHSLRPTRLGGLPLCLNAWERLGWAAALEAWCTAHAPGLSAAEISLRAMAACSPWLAAWSRLPAQARRALLQDPASAALPVADGLPQVEPAQAEALLLGHWQAAPAGLRALGRRGWCQLNAGCRQAGWRGLRTLLWRPAWVQLSATHLEVVYRLQQVDLAVRRLGLDCDPGWLPWFGRIVQLHYEPAETLPAWPAVADPSAPTRPRSGPP